MSQIRRRLGSPGTGGQVVRFAFVGGFCTLLYLVLFVCFRLAVGPQAANILSLLISAVVNTVLNRRITFGLAGRTEIREHASGLVAFGLGAGLTAAGLAILDAADPHPGRALEVAVLLGASLLATLVRFVLFQRWVFASALARHQAATSDS